MRVVKIVAMDVNRYFENLKKELHQHPQLTVGLKARKHPGGMVVVKKLSTEFQVQFISKLLIRSRM